MESKYEIEIDGSLHEGGGQVDLMINILCVKHSFPDIKELDGSLECA